MKVLLREDVDNLGYAGEVHKVADGYGRNYLIPKGFAVIATPSVMKQASAWRKKAEARREQIREEYRELSEKINGLILNFNARAGETGKLYGSVTTAQVADAMNEELGIDVDRRKVGVEPLRQLGEHQVVVRLSGEFQPTLTVNIHPEEEEEVVEEVVEEEVVEEEVETAEMDEVEEADEA